MKVPSCSCVYKVHCFGNLFRHQCPFKYHVMQRDQFCTNTWRSDETRTSKDCQFTLARFVLNSYRFLLFSNIFTFFTFTCLLTAGVVGAPQTISLFFLILCSLGFGQLQACPFPDIMFPSFFLSTLSSSPVHCALQDGFGQTSWREDHVSLRLFTVVRRSSCGSIASESLHRLPRW